jgi:hypothetical protein
MPTPAVQSDRPHDLELTVSGLESDEIHALWEWFCYTKPLGEGIRVVAPRSAVHAGFSVVAAGNEPGACETATTGKLMSTEVVSE